MKDFLFGSAIGTFLFIIIGIVTKDFYGLVGSSFVTCLSVIIYYFKNK